MPVRPLFLPGCFLLGLGLGACTGSSPTGPTAVPSVPSSAPTASTEEKPKPAPRDSPSDTTEKKPEPDSADTVAEKYLAAEQGGPLLHRGAALETKEYRLRREAAKDKASPDHPYYKYGRTQIDARNVDGEGKIVFEGKAQVQSRVDPDNKGQTFVSIGSGGPAHFTLTTVKSAQDSTWRVDDFRFARRSPSVALAELEKEELEREVKETMAYPQVVWDRLSLAQLERTTGKKSWVFYYVGGPLQFRLKAEEVGQTTRATQGFFGEGWEEPYEEGRLCLQIGRDVRNDGSFGPTDTVVVTAGRNRKEISDLPYLWYDWKGVTLRERAPPVELTGTEEARALEIEATETQPPAGAEPRKVVLSLWVKRAPKK